MRFETDSGKNMTDVQKIFFGVGILAILGLGVVVYKQFTAPALAPTTNTMKGEGRSDTTSKKAVSEAETPSTPEGVVDDILSEVDEDNWALSEEELGETSEIEAEGSVVSDFENVYDANEN